MVLSILLANYNNAKYIEECINSLLAQTYKNIEIVILDDRSTDNSLEKLNSIKTVDSRIRLFTNKSNKGIGWTKRKLVELSRGELFGFVDPDDKLRSNAVEIMVEAHKNNFNCGLIYSNLMNINPEGVETLISDFNCVIPETSSFLEMGKGISHFVTFKRIMYNKTEGINQLLKIAEDQDIYFKMEEIAPILFINKDLYLYRNHDGAISLFSNQTRAHVWQVIARYEAFKRRGLEINEEHLIRYFINREIKYNRLLKVVSSPKDLLRFIILKILNKLNARN
jgi:glycosyltransferase involved in cell wall biosynthesis